MEKESAKQQEPLVVVQPIGVDASAPPVEGFDSLRDLNVVHVRRESWFTNYAVRTASGEKIYRAVTGKIGFRRQYAVQDAQAKPAFSFTRGFCCMNIGNSSEVAIHSSAGNAVAHIMGAAGFNTSSISIGDAAKRPILSMTTPIGWFAYHDVVFEVKTSAGQVAKITRRFPGWCSMRHNYVIEFPADLDVTMKAALVVTAVKMDVELLEISNQIMMFWMLFLICTSFSSLRSIT